MKISDTLDADSCSRFWVTGVETVYGVTAQHLEYLPWYREHYFRQKS